MLASAVLFAAPQCAVVQHEILAHELTWGPGGARIAVVVSSPADGVLLSGTDLVAASFALPADRPSFDARARGPSHRIVLRDGDVLRDVLEGHGVRGPLGPQAPLADLIAPWLEPGGTVVLGAHEQILLFELGTDDPRSRAWDFQDLVVRRAACETASDRVPRGLRRGLLRAWIDWLRQVLRSPGRAGGSPHPSV